MGTAKLPILIDGRKTIHKFIIIKNPNEPGLIGNDFIEEKRFKYDSDIRTFYWSDQKPQWSTAMVIARKMAAIPPLSVATISVRLHTDQGSIPDPSTTCITHVTHPDKPLMVGPSALLDTNLMNHH